MRLRNLALATTGTTFFLMMLGSYVKSIGARFSCPDWPLCYGQVLPPFPTAEFTSHQIMAEWLHRDLAAVVTGLTIWLFVEIRRRYRDQENLVTSSILSVGLLLAQVVLGAATVRFVHPLISVLHLGMAVLFFTSLVLLTTMSWRLEGPTYSPPERQAEPAAAPRTADEPLGPQAITMGRRVADYLSILKPRILLLLLVSAITTMFVAVGTRLDPVVVTLTLVGGAFSAGAGNAFNMYLERDIDALMTRTRNRPIPSGRLPANHVLAYGIVLAVLSFAILATWVNLLAAYLALGGAVFYVVVYTLWLKRTRPNNIVIGGAAGGFPALVAWAAVTGEVNLTAMVLGFIVFLWTPPHFWAIAIFRKQEYANAGIPMLPVVKGEQHTNQQIFLYAIATMVATTALFAMGVLSAFFLFAASVLGALFVWYAFENLRLGTPRTAYRLFRFSLLYLGLVFVAMAVDAVWLAPELA